MSHLLRWTTPVLLLGLSSCQGNDFQSSLHPASEEARAIAWLWWLMLTVYGAVFVITLALTAMALVRKRKPEENQSPQAPGGPFKFVVIAGIIVPTIILVAMLILSLRTSSAMRVPETAFTIEVIGHQWWWEVRYPDDGFATANEIRIPVGVPVGLQLGSGDVIHSFWVPNLHGKMDMVPEHRNRFWLQAERTGSYRGICAEFCGGQHALMGLDVVVMDADDFAEWKAQRQVPPAAPAAPLAIRGRDVFFEAGCAACHAVAGTGAVANLGPDLTHLAVRRTLGASTILNNVENLTRWIVEPQALKPGNLMPRTLLDRDDLDALIAYLQTLH
jgi:cytochrome c oxidase subunit II